MKFSKHVEKNTPKRQKIGANLAKFAENSPKFSRNGYYLQNLMSRNLESTPGHPTRTSPRRPITG
jgi:hypothetical protein